ncbi:hypothetical protein M432DRAFT_153645 [Thermoascus aurantiacus ATCC 26904]
MYIDLNSITFYNPSNLPKRQKAPQSPSLSSVATCPSVYTNNFYYHQALQQFTDETASTGLVAESPCNNHKPGQKDLRELGAKTNKKGGGGGQTCISNGDSLPPDVASLHSNLEKAEEATGTVESGTLLPLKNIPPPSHQECQPFEGGKPDKHQDLPLIKDNDNDNSDLQPDNVTSPSIPSILTDQTSDLKDTCFTSPDIVSGGSLLRSPANKDSDMASMTKLNYETKVPRDPQPTEC